MHFNSSFLQIQHHKYVRALIFVVPLRDSKSKSAIQPNCLRACGKGVKIHISVPRFLCVINCLTQQTLAVTHTVIFLQQIQRFQLTACIIKLLNSNRTDDFAAVKHTPECLEAVLNVNVKTVPCCKSSARPDSGRHCSRNSIRSGSNSFLYSIGSKLCIFITSFLLVLL